MCVKSKGWASQLLLSCLEGDTPVLVLLLAFWRAGQSLLECCREELRDWCGGDDKALIPGLLAVAAGGLLVPDSLASATCLSRFWPCLLAFLAGDSLSTWYLSCTAFTLGRLVSPGMGGKRLAVGGVTLGTLALAFRLLTLLTLLLAPTLISSEDGLLLASPCVLMRCATGGDGCMGGLPEAPTDSSLLALRKVGTLWAAEARGRGLAGGDFAADLDLLALRVGVPSGGRTLTGDISAILLADCRMVVLESIGNVLVL
jgi:hypothetical protein